MDSRICQTSTATPAEPGGLPFVLATSFLLLIVIFRGIAEKGDRTCVENRKMAIGSVARYNGRRLVARRNLVCPAPSQEAGGSSR